MWQFSVNRRYPRASKPASSVDRPDLAVITVAGESFTLTCSVDWTCEQSSKKSARFIRRMRCGKWKLAGKTYRTFALAALASISRGILQGTLVPPTEESS